MPKEYVIPPWCRITNDCKIVNSITKHLLPMKKHRVHYYTDPVHGIISFPSDLIQKVIDHPYLQRLRRITQCGLSHYVFPGANHTRFHHTLGVAHLASRVLNVLRDKGVEINDEEYEATILAALLHDIGHGPYSHAMEKEIVPYHHEEISLLIAESLNHQFNGQLSLAISILMKEYSKTFLHQLIASQLDVDRMDYLTRDSFYTGIEEGRVGIDRLIRTFTVHDNKLVSEEKALQTIEKFLVARHHMYWQVYIHKAVLSIQQMLILLMERIKYLVESDQDLNISQELDDLIRLRLNKTDEKFLHSYMTLDDISIMQVIKSNVSNEDKVFSFLCKSLLNRKIFRLEWINIEKKEYLISQKLHHINSSPCDLHDEIQILIKTGTEKSDSYVLDNEIEILTNQGLTIPLSAASHVFFKEESLSKSFICYPRLSD